MGRPPIELSKRDILQIEALAALGRTIAEIAFALGFSTRTFYNKKAVDDEVFAAWTRGRLKGVTSIAAANFRNALEGDQRSIEFYLGAFHGISVRTPQGELTPGLEGVEGDSDDPFLIADPHDELLRRYEEIAKRQEEAEAATAEAPPSQPFTPREHMPEDDAPPDPRDDPHRQEDRSDAA